MILDSPALRFDKPQPYFSKTKRPANATNQKTERKDQFTTTLPNTNHLNSIKPTQALSRIQVIPEHMRAARMESKTLLNRLTALKQIPYSTNTEKERVKKSLFDQCQFSIMTIYDLNSKQSHKKPKPLLMLETVLDDIPYAIPLSLETHGGHIILTDRSDLTYQIQNLSTLNPHLQYKKEPLTLRTQEKYAVLDCLKKLDAARKDADLPSLFHQKNTLLGSLYQGAHRRMENHYNHEIELITQKTANVLKKAQLKFHSRSKTMGFDCFNFIFSNFIPDSASEGTRYIPRGQRNREAPISEQSVHAAEKSVHTPTSGQNLPASQEDALVEDALVEDTFFDCSEIMLDADETMEARAKDIKKLAKEYLKQQALKNEGRNIMNLHLYSAKIDAIGCQLRDDIKRIEYSMYTAHGKHKETIDQRNRDMQERTTKALLLTCIVIAACVAPVAAIPLFATMALAGTSATVLAFSGITLFSQLAAWVFRKSTLEPLFLNRLRARQAHQPADGALTKDQIHTKVRTALSTVYTVFKQQKAEFSDQYPSSKFSLDDLVSMSMDEIHSELQSLMNNHPQKKEDFLKIAVHNVLDYHIKEREDFIENLKKMASISPFYPYAELSYTLLESNQEIELNEFFEKQLWAQYILDHHIGDNDYPSTSRIEPVIIYRLEHLGILPTNHLSKKLFLLEKLDPKTLQALREWAIAFYNPLNDHLSIYKKLNQTIQAINQKKNPASKASNNSDFFYREQFIQFKTP